MNQAVQSAAEDQGRGELALTRTHPDWDRVKSFVLDALPSAHSRRIYARALDEFRAWAAQGAPEGFTKAAVQRYRAHLEALALAPSTINLRLTAVRKLAQEAADNGLLDPERASAIGRVKGTPQKGRRLGNWLSREQASDLLKGCAGNTRKELRDRALLCLLVGCGLRRAEAAALTVEHIQQREAAG
jgi:site-specific recombinase XerD